MLKRIMTKAHQLARKFEGDYQARLSIALRLAWKIERGNDKVNVNQFFSKDVELNEEMTKLVIEARDKKEKMSINEIINNVKGWRKLRNKKALFSFGDQETWDMWDVVETANGLSIRDADGKFITYINREEYQQLKELHSTLAKFDYDD